MLCGRKCGGSTPLRFARNIARAFIRIVISQAAFPNARMAGILPSRPVMASSAKKEAVAIHRLKFQGRTSTPRRISAGR